MKKNNDIDELESFLENNAANLIESKEDKGYFVKYAKSDTQLRVKRAKRLQDLRKNKLRITQKTLAGAVGANVRTLQSWESGRQDYPKSVEILMKLINDIPLVRKKLISN